MPWRALKRRQPAHLDLRLALFLTVFDFFFNLMIVFCFVLLYFFYSSQFSFGNKMFTPGMELVCYLVSKVTRQAFLVKTDHCQQRRVCKWCRMQDLTQTATLCLKCATLVD